MLAAAVRRYESQYCAPAAGSLDRGERVWDRGYARKHGELGCASVPEASRRADLGSRQRTNKMRADVARLGVVVPVPLGRRFS